MITRFFLFLIFCFVPFLGSAQTLYTTWPNDDGYSVDSITYKFDVTSVATTSQVQNNATIVTRVTQGPWTLHGYSHTFSFMVNSDGTLTLPAGGPANQISPYEIIFSDSASVSEAAQQPAFNYVADYPTSSLLPVNSPAIKTTFSAVDPAGHEQWHDTVQFVPFFYWNDVESWFSGTALAAIVSPYPNTYPTAYNQSETVQLIAKPEKCKICRPGGCASCHAHGMTLYSLDQLHGSFSLDDTPVSYSPPLGPGVSFSISYNQTDVGQLAVQPFSNIGPNWTYSALAYITNRPDDINVNVTRFAPGGGLEYYNLFTVSSTSTGVFDPKTGRYTFPQTSAPERSSRAVLSWNPTLGQYTRALPDGSSEVYGQWVNSGGTNYYLLTKMVDAQGNTISYSYDAQGRLLTITDSIGQITTYSYNSTVSPMLISKVSDPFGRSALLEYDTHGRLSSCTDPIGMVSSYGYDVNGNVTSLTTPYGTTTFSIDVDAGHSGVTITNPLGQPERVELRLGSVSTIPDSDPAAIVPTFTSTYLPAGYALQNSGLSSDNTFYWDRKQYAAHSPIQYTDAQITHWQPGPHGLTPAPASTKQPLENRVWMVYSGQATGGYVDDSDQTSAVAIGRVLDDGTTQATYAGYNGQGNMTQSVDPIGRTTNMTYDVATGIDLLTTKQVDGTGSDLLNTLTYTNATQTSSTHLPLTSIDASGQTTTMTYNGQGQILTSTDPKSEETTYSYTGPSGTGTGNFLTTVTAPTTGATTKYTYDSVSRLSTITDSEGYVITYNYDNLDRRTKVIYPDSTFDQTVYKNLDAVQMIDRQGRTTIKQYDAIREVLSVTDALNRVTQYGWCLCGGLASLTDPNHNLTQWTLDNEGRVTAKTYADSSQIIYTYENSTSRLHQMQDANGNKAVYSYNEDDTMSGTIYTVGTGIAPTPNVSFTYDPAYNRVKTMADGVGTTTYTYNPVPTSGLPVTGANMLGSISAPIGLGNNTAAVGTAAIAYNYDQLGRVTNYTIDGSSNNSVSTTFDALGRVTNVSNPLGAFVYAYVDTTSRLKSLTYPTSTGLVSNLSYFPNVCPTGTGNGDERLQTISNVKGSTNISNFQYTYNPVGTIATWQQQTDSNTPTQYALTYDAVDQITNAVNTNTSTHAVVNSNGYEYDLMGNRLAETTQSATNVGQFNNLNQLKVYNTSAVTQSVSGHTSSTITSSSIDTVPATISNSTNFIANVPVPAGTNTITVQAQNGTGFVNEQKVQIVTTGGTTPAKLTYDKDGNVMQDESGNTYTWDALNRLITIKYPSAATSNFAYDGSSRRTSIVEKSNAGIVTSTKLYLWFGNTIADERNSTNVVQKRFYPQGEQQSGTAYLYTNDHLGSVRELISATGAITSRLSYDVYGRTTVVSGTTLPTFEYARYYNHSPSGLCFTRAGSGGSIGRPFKPNTGTWLERDSIGEGGGTNLYEYCDDNSIIGKDSLGTSPYSGTKPVYDPNTWNDPTSQKYNNCYDYAVDRRHSGPGGYGSFTHPGEESGTIFPGAFTRQLTCSQIIAYAKKDGLASPNAHGDCPKCYHKVILVLAEHAHQPGGPDLGPDYHWYRQDSNGGWSSKHGGLPVGPQVPDPLADANSWGYTNHCGTLCAPDK